MPSFEASVEHPPLNPLQDVVTLPCVGRGRYLSVQKRAAAANFHIGNEDGCWGSGVLTMAEVQVLGQK